MAISIIIIALSPAVFVNRRLFSEDYCNYDAIVSCNVVATFPAHVQTQPLKS